MAKKKTIKEPKEGYSNEEKAKYRKDVWEPIFEIFNKHKDKGFNFYGEEVGHKYKILVLPSREGIELDYLLNNYDIRQDDIIAVEEHAHDIAHSEWRKKYPNVNFFSGKVSEVGDKIADKGWVISAANLDFCYNLSYDLINEVDQFIRKAPLDIHSFLSITIMKGREGRAITMMLDRLNNHSFDDCRLATFKELLGYVDDDNSPVIEMPSNEGQYKSYNFNVVYGTFLLINNSIDLSSIDSYVVYNMVCGEVESTISQVERELLGENIKLATMTKRDVKDNIYKKINKGYLRKMKDLELAILEELNKDYGFKHMMAIANTKKEMEKKLG